MEAKAQHSINPDLIRYVVLAGSLKEFYNWQTYNRIPKEEALYISHSEILHRRFPSTTIFVEVGTFSLRPDVMHILDTLRTQHPTSSIVQGTR